MPAKERISMRLRWIPLFEYCTVGDILTSEEYREYTGRPEPVPYYRTSSTIPKKPIEKPSSVIVTQTAYEKRRFAIYRAYEGICWLCNLHVSRNDFSIDHVIPRSKGGTNAIDNLRVAHKVCNSIKSSHPINSSHDFFEHIKSQSKLDRQFSKHKRKLMNEFEKAKLAHQVNNK